MRDGSVSHVLAEVQDTRAEHPLELVHFVADIFSIDSRWLAELCFPALMPLARRRLSRRWLRKPLLLMYGLDSEWMVTEQNQLYRKAQGERWTGLLAPLDIFGRAAR